MPGVGGKDGNLKLGLFAFTVSTLIYRKSLQPWDLTFCFYGNHFECLF